MDWLASLSIDWVLTVAFALTVARLGLATLRKRIGEKNDQNYGELLESLLFAWVVVFLMVRPFFYEPFSIPSASMRDTLKEGDRILVNKYLYRFRPPQRGDVIVFKSPPEAGQGEADFVKRLIGMPGDTVDLQNGRVLINGKELNEPYAPEPSYDVSDQIDPQMPHPPYQIPSGHYLMLGDNRTRSQDSRFWGYLNEDRIKGKAIAIFWPPGRFGRLRDPVYTAGK